MSSDNLTIALTALVLVGIYRFVRWCIAQAICLWATYRPVVTTAHRRNAEMTQAFVANRKAQAEAYNLVRLGFVPLIVNGEVIMYISNDNDGNSGICDVAIIAGGEIHHHVDWAYVTPQLIQVLEGSRDTYYPLRGEWLADGVVHNADIVWDGFPAPTLEPVPVPVVNHHADYDPTADWPRR